MPHVRAHHPILIPSVPVSEGIEIRHGFNLLVGSTVGKSPAHQKDTSKCYSHFIPDPGHPTQRRWKKIAPFLRREWGVRWACLAIFFLALGLGEVLHLGTPGTCLRREQRRVFSDWSDQPKGLVYALTWTDTFSLLHRLHHHHHTTTQTHHNTTPQQHNNTTTTAPPQQHTTTTHNTQQQHTTTATLAARVRLVISRLFFFKKKILCSLSISMDGFVWSGLCICLLLFMVLKLLWWHWIVCVSSARLCRQPLASVGAVLRLLDGPTGCDPVFCEVWFRFRFFRRYLAGRAYRLLELVGEGCPGHGPIHLLSASAAEIGFRWDPLTLAWSRPGLPLLSYLAGPIQHFKAAILDAWRNKVGADLCGREGFREGPLLDVHGSLQLLISSHVWDRDKG